MPLIVLEQTAMRAGEAARLVRTAERRVFPRFSVDGAEKAMAAACKVAEIARFTPHDLGHRRATGWHHEGVPTQALANVSATPTRP